MSIGGRCAAGHYPALTLAGEYAFFQRTFGGLVYASVFLGILGSLVYR